MKKTKDRGACPAVFFVFSLSQNRVRLRCPYLAALQTFSLEAELSSDICSMQQQAAVGVDPPNVIGVGEVVGELIRCQSNTIYAQHAVTKVQACSAADLINQASVQLAQECDVVLGRFIILHFTIERPTHDGRFIAKLVSNSALV